MKGTVEATKVMIEGRLVELDHDPRAVQVEVHEDESGRVTVCLCNSHGTFLRADCLPMRESSAEVEGTATGEAQDGNGETELTLQATRMVRLSMETFGLRTGNWQSSTTS